MEDDDNSGWSRHSSVACSEEQQQLTHAPPPPPPPPTEGTNNYCEPSQMQEEEIIMLCSQFDDDDDEKNDENDDPQWCSFIANVRQGSGNLAGLLASAFVDEGANCTALLGKLVHRSLSLSVGGGSNQEDTTKCATIILEAVFHLTVHHVSMAGVVVDVVSMMFTQLRHFPTTVLHATVVRCLEHLRNATDPLPLRWVELLGKIVAVLVGRGRIQHGAAVLNGKTFRQLVISEICQVEWTSQTAASLLSALREIPDIEPAQVKSIIERLRLCVKGMRPADFPPTIHQLLLIAGSRHSQELLSLCSEYFGSTRDLLADTSTLAARQKRNALGSVVSHFLESARHRSVVVKAVVAIVKASFFDFGRVMNPFLLSVALGLTTLDHARRQIVEALRNSILSSFHSVHLSKTSYWYQLTMAEHGSKVDVTECFQAVLQNGRSSELEFMLDGLRELAIGLLEADSSQLQYPNTLQRSRELGHYLISSILKASPDQLPTMMRHLLQIPSSSKSHHVVLNDCLAVCLETRTRQVIHTVGSTSEIIRSLSLMDAESAANIVDAMSTALQLSSPLLNQLMLQLQKNIWKTVEARRGAAKIMISLLSRSRVVGDVPFSQFSASQRAIRNPHHSTDSSIGQLPDNQPVCLEILALIKRCLTQQWEVRQELYLGLPAVVEKNPALCELICSLLLRHANQYLFAAQVGPFLRMTSVVETTTTTTTISEQLGCLVQCLCCVVRQSRLAFAKLNERPPPVAVDQLETVIGKYTDAVLSTSLMNNIERAASTVVGDLGGPDLVRRVGDILAFQLMQITEALIEFLNFSQPTNDNNNKHGETTIRKLFDKRQLLERISSSSSKREKARARPHPKKQRDKSKKLTDELEKGPLPDRRPEASLLISLPTYRHMITIEGCQSILIKLLLGSGDGQLNGDKDFEKVVLNTVQQRLTEEFTQSWRALGGQFLQQREGDRTAHIFVDIAGTVWTKIVRSVTTTTTEISALDKPAIEKMKQRAGMVGVIAEHLCRAHPPQWRPHGDEQRENATIDETFPKFFKSWKLVHQWFRADDEQDTFAVHRHLFKILQSLCQPLPPDSRQRSQAGEVLHWIWAYMSHSHGAAAAAAGTSADVLLAEAVVSCWTRFYMKARGALEQPGLSQHDLLTVARAVRQTLGRNNEGSLDPTETQRIWIVNYDTAPTIFTLILSYIEELLVQVSALLATLKSPLPTTTTSDNDDDRVADVREGCFCMIDQIVLVASELIISDFPPGTCVTTTLRVIPQIFSLMTGFADYFLELSRKKAEYSLTGFTRPVSRVGKQFKGHVETMITRIERIQRECAEEITAKKKSASKRSAIIGRVPAALRQQLQQDKKLIPNLVYSIEVYDQHIIALSNKKKEEGVPLLIGMKLSKSRDFMIDSVKLSNALLINAVEQGQIFTPSPSSSTNSTSSSTAGDVVDVPNTTALNELPHHGGRKRKFPLPDADDPVQY